MPTYTFEVIDGSGGIADDVGVNLRNRDDALRYAQNVIHELMSHREADTRHWRLDVYESEREPVFKIPFFSIDQSFAHLAPEWRARMEDVCGRRLALAEAAQAARATLSEARALVARSRGRLYLATDRGRKIIRD
jgi:hypothetical protein